MVSKDREEYNKFELSKIFKKYQTQLKDRTLDNWKSFVYNVLSSIESIYGKDSTRYNIISKLLDESNLIKMKTDMNDYLDSTISELKTIGTPIYQAKPAYNNTLKQEVHNSVNVNFDNIIEQNLPPIIISEIKEILNTSNNQKDKKNKIVEVLKEAGENIIAKTLSEIISNVLK